MGAETDNVSTLSMVAMKGCRGSILLPLLARCLRFAHALAPQNELDRTLEPSANQTEAH